MISTYTIRKEEMPGNGATNGHTSAPAAAPSDALLRELLPQLREPKQVGVAERALGAGEHDHDGLAAFVRQRRHGFAGGVGQRERRHRGGRLGGNGGGDEEERKEATAIAVAEPAEAERASVGPCSSMRVT